MYCSAPNFRRTIYFKSRLIRMNFVKLSEFIRCTLIYFVLLRRENRESFSLGNLAGSKKIEKDRNWRIRKDRTFLSLPTHHFASPKLYLFLSLHLSKVTGNIYLFLSLVYPPTEVVSIFFSIIRDQPLVSFSIPHLSPHSANFNLSQYSSVSILTTK